jgi:AraC-like DNA-binding protein
MHEFYKKAFLGCVCLIVVSVVFGYVCLRKSYLQLPLLPAQESQLAWKARPGMAYPAGSAGARIQEDPQRLRFDYRLSAAEAQPFVAAELFFEDGKGKPIHVDLSRYSSISLLVKCSPANTLVFSVPTFEQPVPKPDDYLSYRVPQSHFSCTEKESRIEIDLTRLETPQWWFYRTSRDLSQMAYKLDRVPKLSFGTTFQSPRNVLSDVDIRTLELEGRDYRYLALLAGLLLISWGGFGLWFFRKHASALVADVKSKLQKDLPFVAYQQLSLEPQRDKEKMVLTQYISTQYANADLDLDTVVEKTGINKNKINDILKSELGFTFTGYLNKLRLTEAARLLAEKNNAAVAEIAYSIGYGNVSYFNKLFKEEYGCTPKAFRNACQP